jgi:hypothetical protein
MQQINSFDIFDTLIARKCVAPSSIFDIVADKIEYSQFKEQRIIAEKNIISKDYTFNDIYEEFAKITGLSAEQIEDIKRLELATELEQCIPIKQNIDLVQDGDLLVSDMYLPKEFIQQMLEKAGLKKHISLIVTSGGKHYGWIWPLLKNYYIINAHHGDNKHSDIESARKNNIFSIYTETYKLTKTEATLHNQGFSYLSKLIREIRLSTLSTSDGASSLQKDQLQLEYNLPILTLTAIYIKYISTKINSANILFSSRDCYHLFNIYRSLFSRIEDTSYSKYFFTSRYARTRCSSNYSDYVNKIATSQSLFVDLCGTGRSLSVMYEKTAISPSTFLLHKLNYNAIDAYNNTANVEECKNILSIIETHQFDNSILELLNYVDHGMVLDIEIIKELEIFKPIFELPQYPHQVTNYIKRNNFIIDRFINLISNCDLNSLILESFDSIESIPALIASLYKDLNSESSVLNDIRHYHDVQDAHTMWKLHRN